jgi:hypothetical protein
MAVLTVSLAQRDLRFLRAGSSGKRAEAALLAASRCLFSSGSLLPVDPTADGEDSPTLAARIGWRRPRGVVLAPVAMASQPAGER